MRLRSSGGSRPAISACALVIVRSVEEEMTRIRWLDIGFPSSKNLWYRCRIYLPYSATRPEQCQRTRRPESTAGQWTTSQYLTVHVSNASRCKNGFLGESVGDGLGFPTGCWDIVDGSALAMTMDLRVKYSRVARQHCITGNAQVLSRPL